jgi:hypothetical protein
VPGVLLSAVAGHVHCGGCRGIAGMISGNRAIARARAGASAGVRETGRAERAVSCKGKAPRLGGITAPAARGSGGENRLGGRAMKGLGVRAPRPISVPANAKALSMGFGASRALVTARLTAAQRKDAAEMTASRIT